MKKSKRKIKVPLWVGKLPPDLQAEWVRVHGNTGHGLEVKRAHNLHFPQSAGRCDAEAMERRVRERCDGFDCGCPGAVELRRKALARGCYTFYL